MNLQYLLILRAVKKPLYKSCSLTFVNLVKAFYCILGGSRYSLVVIRRGLIVLITLVRHWSNTTKFKKRRREIHHQKWCEFSTLTWELFFRYRIRNMRIISALFYYSARIRLSPIAHCYLVLNFLTFSLDVH